jgi:hypothetical protein
MNHQRFLLAGARGWTPATLGAIVIICQIAICQIAAAGQLLAITPQEKGQAKTAAQSTEPESSGWRPLLPSEGLEGWEITDFYGHGKVTWDGRLLVFEEGKPLTGITYDKKDVKFPTNNFEIELEAKRIRGNDFLCGLTFPVGKGFCSFIAGGWGGGLVGLSSIDGADASENATTTYHDFKNDQWYRFKVAVDDDFVRCWIDGEEVVSQERENHQFTTRIEVYASQPLGLCVFNSRVEIRNFRWRPLGEEVSTSP